MGLVSRRASLALSLLLAVPAPLFAANAETRTASVT